MLFRYEQTNADEDLILQQRLTGDKSSTFGIPSVGFSKSNFLSSHGLEALSDIFISGSNIEARGFLSIEFFEYLCCILLPKAVIGAFRRFSITVTVSSIYVFTSNI
jgi:hypothetical protein